MGGMIQTNHNGSKTVIPINQTTYRQVLEVFEELTALSVAVVTASDPGEHPPTVHAGYQLSLEKIELTGDTVDVTLSYRVDRDTSVINTISAGRDDDLAEAGLFLEISERQVSIVKWHNGEFFSPRKISEYICIGLIN